MNFREAHLEDIEQLSAIRLSVKENQLSNPSLITFQDYEDYLLHRGKGWVCEMDGQLVGFAIVDLQEHNIWALFVKPGYEGLGVGRHLFTLLLEWYFQQIQETLWLSTAPGTRAANFYEKGGWVFTGPYGKNEIRLELSFEKWKAVQTPKE